MTTHVRAVAAGLVLAFVAGILIPGASRPVTANAPGTLDLHLPDETTSDSDRWLVPPVPAPVDLATLDLDAVIESATAEARALPAADWLVPELAQSLDYDPLLAFQFVRDRLGFDPYVGVLRGPAGTLAARAGNAWDRALLLGALLDQMQVAHRFALATLDASTAERVLTRAFEPAADPLPRPGIEATPMFDVDSLAVRARRDDARIRDALGDSIERIAANVRPASPDLVRQHAWIQVRRGADWIDLDPTLPDAVAGTSLVPAASTVDVVPHDMRQMLRMRIEVDLIADDGAHSTVIPLERDLDPVLDARRELFLYFQPDLSGVGGRVVTALTGSESWAPVLLVDGEELVGDPFPVGGRGTDVFGEPVDRQELVAVRIVVTRHLPGSAESTAVRTLIDRAPESQDPATALAVEDLAPLPSDAAGPISLGRIHHLSVSTGATDPRAYAYARAGATAFVSGALLDEDAALGYPFADHLWPVAVADQSMVVASELAIVPALDDQPGIRAFIGAPRLYITSWGADDMAGNVIGTETDLLVDDVAVLARSAEQARAVVRRQLWYGSLQTALETQFALIRLAGMGGGDLLGASMTTQPLTVVEPGSDLASIAPAAAASVTDGQVALIPGDPASARVWWTVDPMTGATRSRLDPGLGGTGGAGKKVPNLPGKDTNNWGDNKGQYSPAKSNPLPNGCRPGQEYVFLVGCVSAPAAQAIRLGAGLGTLVIVSIAIVVITWVAG